MASLRPERLADSLFQVNMLLWMVQPPSGANIKTHVRPLLHEAGYRLSAVERDLPLPVALRERLTKAGVGIRQVPQPDLLFVADDSDFLLVECKSKMFGATTNGDDGHLKQARSHLLQTPPVLKEALGGINVKHSHLAYLCRHQPRHKQSDGLRTLATQLQKSGFDVVEQCVLRLSSSARGVCIEPVCAGDVLPKPLARLMGKSRSKIVVMPYDRSRNDPRPLYLVPWMPNTEYDKSDSYNLKVFQSRILAAAVTRFGRSHVGDPVSINVEELLNDVTRGVYALWKNKQARSQMHDKVKELLFAHLRKVSGIMFAVPRETPSIINVLVPDEKTRSSIIRELHHTVDENWQPNERTLFDKPDDFWESDEAATEQWKQ